MPVRTGVAFRPIIAKKPREGNIPRRFKNLVNQVAKEIEEELQKPIASWKHKVKFARFVRYGYPRTIYLRVSTTDEIYNYQDQGTKAHDVKPKNASVLSWIDPGSGKRLYSKGHRVSGVKANRWTNKVKRQYAKRIREIADQMMREIATEDL